MNCSTWKREFRYNISACEGLPCILNTYPQWCRYIQVNSFTLRAPLERNVCYFQTFENNLRTERKFTKYLKESCSLASDKHLSFKCFPENAFVSNMFPNLSGLFWLLWVLMGYHLLSRQALVSREHQSPQISHIKMPFYWKKNWNFSPQYKCTFLP